MHKANQLGNESNPRSIPTVQEYLLSLKEPGSDEAKFPMDSIDTAVQYLKLQCVTSMGDLTPNAVAALYTKQNPIPIGIIGALEHYFTSTNNLQCEYSLSIFPQLHVLPDVQNRFERLLNEANIQRPDLRVFRMIVNKFEARMKAADSPREALDLYEEVANIPQTSTRAHLYTVAGLIIDGEAFESAPSIVSVFTREGVPKILKVHLTGDEAEVCKRLQSAPDEVPIVRGKPIQVTLGEREFSGLLMDRYICSLANVPQLPVEVLARGVRSMMQALSYIHNVGLVHMDVKTANVMIRIDGSWHLGDFGACVKAGKTVKESTHSFCLHKSGTVFGERAKAHPKFDWSMLLVMCCIELQKPKNKNDALEVDISLEYVLSTLDHENEDFRQLLHEIARRAEHIS